MPEPETPRDEPEDAGVFEEASKDAHDEGADMSPDASADASPDASPDARPEDAPPESAATPRREGVGAGEKKAASVGAVERLKARAARDSARAGVSSKSKAARSSRRRLGDAEREALWRQAVARKARKIKLTADALILLCLACVLGAHALPFVGELKGYGPRRGYEIVLDLARVDFERTAEDDAFAFLAGTKPGFVAAEGQPGYLRFEANAPVDALSLVYIAVPAGAALLFLLYLLDFLVWMGRPLPVLSLVYGFGSVVYLMVTKVPRAGAWSIIGSGGRAAMIAWYMLLVPLFLLGTFSMLRLFFSARRKRYAYAGLEPPARPAPAAVAEGGPKADATDDFRATPVSSPAIRPEGLAGGGGDDAEPPPEAPPPEAPEEPPPGDG